jgi:hypothetical protein
MLATTTTKILGIAATAVGVAGVLTIPTASGMPPFHMAPACTEWKLDDASQAFDTASGGQIYLPWNKGTGTVRTGNNDAAFVSPQVNMKGAAQGGINGSGFVDVTVNWTSGVPDSFHPHPWIHFTGNVNENGALEGDATNDNNVTEHFTARTPYTCSKQAAAEQPAGPPAAVTDAITLTFAPPDFGSITATVANSSDLTAKCTYDSTPFKNHRDFTVDPHGSTPLTFSGVNLGISYHVTVSCKDASGTQQQPIGVVNQDVSF